MRLVDPSPEARAAWEHDWRGRSNFVEHANREQFTVWTAHAVESDGETVGMIASGCGLPHSPFVGVVHDVYVLPGHRRRGVARTAVRLVTGWCAEQGAKMVRVSIQAENPVADRLFADFPVVSRHKVLGVAEAPRVEDDPAVVPVTADAYARWRELMFEDLATIVAENDAVDVAAASTMVTALFDNQLPDGIDTAGNELWMLAPAGTPVAYLWIRIDPTRFECYVQDVLVEPEHRGRGYGRRAMDEALRRARHHRFERVRLHVYADNAAANHLYDDLGYVVVAEHRRKRLGRPVPGEGGGPVSPGA